MTQFVNILIYLVGWWVG